jgi:hypothetical protein
MKTRVLTGAYNSKSAQKAHLLERESKAKDIRITNCSYFPNNSNASNSSSCVVVGGKLYTNIVPSSRPCSVRVAHDGVSSVRLYEYARDLAKPLKDGADVGFDSVWW